MKIRKAVAGDEARIVELLKEIGRFHGAGRPDLFKADAVKMAADELLALFADASKPIYVAEDEMTGLVLGHAFCEIHELPEDAVHPARKVFWIEDLCVTAATREQRIGEALLDFCKEHARELGCVRLELHVFDFPGSATGFYEHEGFRTQARTMEFLL
jgi:GNAT superfamily N-acetyltransferase